MSPVPASRRASAPAHIPGGSRLDAALLHFPRSLFPSEHPALQAEMKEPPAALIVVTMLESLELGGTERVLDVGSPSAYTAALLSKLTAEVYTVVDAAELIGPRERDLMTFGCHNVSVVHGKAGAGWQAAAPYQAIFVGAAAHEVPLPLLHQLEIDGRLVIPIGDARAQLLERVRRRRDALESETLGACHLSMLNGADLWPSAFPWSRG